MTVEAERMRLRREMSAPLLERHAVELVLPTIGCRSCQTLVDEPCRPDQLACCSRVDDAIVLLLGGPRPCPLDVLECLREIAERRHDDEPFIYRDFAEDLLRKYDPTFGASAALEAGGDPQ